jgi:hypothetical protein
VLDEETDEVSINFSAAVGFVQPFLSGADTNTHGHGA